MADYYQKYEDDDLSILGEVKDTELLAKFVKSYFEAL